MMSDHSGGHCDDVGRGIQLRQVSRAPSGGKVSLLLHS